MASTRRTYTIEEANALLPEVRAVLLQLAVQHHHRQQAHEELHDLLVGNRAEAVAEREARLEREIEELEANIRSLLGHLASLDVQVRDLEMGLVDFPGLRDGRPVWLCWRLSDPRVAHWHGTDEGFANRRPW
ncbi:MAG TPA: DUF2203 domain-containing protein [candidate division Zixibacteria bacterium]|nr:DUF2203 domain-containing protein [candidate division Zixibacteria bacterium]